MKAVTRVLFGRRELNRIFSNDYINWAVEMLVQGYDSMNLRILAGMNLKESIYEVEKYFFTALRELGLEESCEPDIAVQAYASEIAQQIIDNHFNSPRQAIRALYDIFLDTNYDPRYVVWLELDDALDFLEAGEFPHTYPSATFENIDFLVKQEAAKLIEMSE